MVSVNVSVVVPSTTMLAAPKALAIVGGAPTVRFAEAVPPVPPLVEVTELVMLLFAPAVVQARGESSCIGVAERRVDFGVNTPAHLAMQVMAQPQYACSSSQYSAPHEP